MLSKMVALFSVMDDTYDNKADIHECRRLNTAIQRWNEDASNLLPEYLRKFYNRLLSNFKEMEEELPEDAKYRFARTKREFQEVSACQLRAAEYYYGNIKPNFEDQVAMSFRAGGGRFLLVGQTIGRDDITDETFELAFGTTIDVDATIACLKLGRFMNDIAAFKLGTNKTDVESAVEWYFHENKVTSDVALAKIESVVEEQWKIINKARFGNPVLFPVMKLAIKITLKRRSVFVVFLDLIPAAHTKTSSRCHPAQFPSAPQGPKDQVEP
ncbi:hypothetical protein QOZ80_9BG0693950 [Eleusine coracana subsp. coracana]|nr:hypothetical protein QOZ80_9BG0693950 [Eleusine coracana subsp. coracana]